MFGHRSSPSTSGLMILDNESTPGLDQPLNSKAWASTSDISLPLPERRSPQTVSLCLFAWSLVCFSIVALALGVGFGIGYTRYKAKTIYAPAPFNYSSYYDIPETLDSVPIDKLINKTELELDTGFIVSQEAKIREYVFNITQAYAAPDGFQKPMVLVNGQSPGPLIEANIGDTIRVHVNNQMASASTTIHWHGINQRGSTWMDGVAGVTQCGIPAGWNFTYEFRVADQRGTFWWHAHTMVQYSDGAYGAIVRSACPSTRGPGS